MNTPTQLAEDEAGARAPTSLLIVTGMSGGGKTVALNTFEDLGFYCVDNLPAELLPEFVRAATHPERAEQKLAVGIDMRNRGDLAKVSVPTLVLQCSNDVIAPTEVGDYVHAAVPGSTLVTLQATGHCPNLSAPEETVAAISSFVRA